MNEIADGWTEERIAAKVREVSHNDLPDMRTRSVTEFQAQQLMGLVWCDCQRAIATLRAQVAELQDALGASESWAKASQETILRQGRDLAAIDLDLERFEQLEADNERLRAQVASLIELNERNCEDALRIINGNKVGVELAYATITEWGKREQYIKQLEAELQQHTEGQG